MKFIRSKNDPVIVPGEPAGRVRLGGIRKQVLVPLTLTILVLLSAFLYSGIRSEEGVRGQKKGSPIKRLSVTH